MDKDRLQMYISLMRITIVLCWLSLFAFWAVKLFGGNLFEIAVQNENFVKLSHYIENSWWRYVSSFVTIFVARYLILCAVGQRFTYKGKDFVFVSLSIISIWSVVNFVPIEFMKMWYCYIVMAGVGIIYQKGYKRIYGAFSMVLDLAFSGISMITRNIELQLVTDYLTLFILGIDVYIMYLLYYLYLNLLRLKKEI